MHRDPGVAAGVVLTPRTVARTPRTVARTLRTVALTLGVAALAACGAEPDPPALTIGFARAELLADARALALYVYDDAPCEAVSASTPRPASRFGPFQAPLDDRARAEGLSFSLDPLPIGVYTFLVDALGDGGALVGSGCAPSQQLVDGETTQIAITLD